MKIREITVESVIEINEYGQPYINPYFGCSAGCPFCYWLSFSEWEGKIDVRMNFPQVLEDYCQKLTGEKPRIYIGSYCDPYMEDVERDYELTRKSLAVLKKYQVPVTICASARSELILRDLDLFVEMKDLKIVTELCRLDQLKRIQEGEEHIGVQMTNILKDRGIDVAATFAPVLPGITEIDPVRKGLRPEIPLYIDTMNIEKGTIQEARILDCVKEWKPELMKDYLAYIDGDREPFEQYVKAWIGKDNIKGFPIEE